MRFALWPNQTEDEVRAEVSQFFSASVPHLLAVFIAIDCETPVGFAELNSRPYAEGCISGRVAFLEGWFVKPRARRRGVGRALIEAAEAWARAQGCNEFASDAVAENALGTAAHRGLGFEEVEMIRCFRKNL